MTQCSYSTPYHNFETDKDDNFQCPKNAIESGRCKLHDDYYISKNRDEIKTLIETEIKDALDNNKPLHCFGYTIYGIKFKGNFTRPLYFNKAFFDDAHFSFCNFTDIDFSDANFNKLFMINSTFSGEAKFVMCRFRDFVDFTSTKFHNAKFVFIEFGDVHFKLVEADSMEFFRTDFNNLDFDIKKIKSVNFRETNFKQGFFAGADFDIAYFEFVKSPFANFQQAKIGCVRYAHTEFEQALFIETTFHHSAEFRNVVFKRSNFEGAIFHKLEFLSSQLQESDFSRTQFNDEARFHKVTFENQEKTIFDVKDLSKVSFLDTNLTRIRFGDKTKWGEKGKIIDEVLMEKLVRERHKKLWKNNVKNRILSPKQIDELEENHRKKALRSVSLEGIRTIYQNLRENYEFRLKYDEAGHFFVRELELKRKFHEVKKENAEYEIEKRGWLARNISLTGIYFWLSKYGESHWRPVLWAIPILFASWSFWAGMIPYIKPDPMFSWDKAIERSVSDFFQLKSDTGADIFFRIMSAPILGMLFIAFRRKFERRFRH